MQTRYAIPVLAVIAVFGCTNANPVDTRPDVAVSDAARPDVTDDATGIDATGIDATAIDATPEASPDSGGVDDARVDAIDACAPGEKRCSGVCVSVDDPAHGCGLPTCSPCAAPFGTAGCSGGLCVVARCASGRGDCDGQASNGCETDLQSAPAHCGACARACVAGQLCDRGACAIRCSGAAVVCAGRCVSTSTDPANCGACGTVCPSPEGGSAWCAAGRCGFACSAGRHPCGAMCASNNHVDTCGARCAPCPAVLHGTPTCDGARCGAACDVGYHACAGACVANNSPETCGGSCVPCVRQPNSVATCDGTSCGSRCDTGFHACRGACVAENSVAACGPSCIDCPVVSNGVRTCDGTRCGVTCAAGYHRCATGCCAWRFDTVAMTTSINDAASMAFDASGQLHVVYWDYDLREVRHARMIGGTWTSATVRRAGVGSHSSGLVAVGSTLHLIFDNSYLTWSGTAWSTPEVIGSGLGLSGHGSDIAVDPAGGIHVTYSLQNSTNGFQYARRGATGWTVEEFDVGSHFEDDVSIRIDPSGVPVVAYRSDAAHRVARRVGGTWVREDFDASLRGYDTVTMAFDATGAEHVVYDLYFDHLWHAVREGTRWTRTRLGTGWGRLGGNASGDLALAYVDTASTPAPLRLLRRAGSSWVPDVVDPDASVGSMARKVLVRADGTAWILVSSSRTLRVYH